MIAAFNCDGDSDVIDEDMEGIVLAGFTLPLDLRHSGISKFYIVLSISKYFTENDKQNINPCSKIVVEKHTKYMNKKIQDIILWTTSSVYER